ncbi:MAG: DUF5017 domain-containing protein [Bacteroidales bacterium]|nr:DUF5017 domain-containing protein [Bacteroidales bacterium]MCF8337040.1 DUF5017 domain-containing protein [Bacteroidales bacterium]
MKKFTFLILAFFGVGILGHAQIISQYIETNSGTEPKGIEIWNNTDSQLDFNANTLLIEQGTNGNPLSEEYTLESGTLDAGDVLVIGTSDLQATTEGNGADFYEHTFQFNGNDALAVNYGGTTIDVFGMPEEDPGSAWEGNGVSTADQNIGLLGGITSGDPDGWTDPSERFETVNTDPSGDNGDEGFGIAPEGGDNQNPSITNIVQTPEVVTSSDEVNVSADVTDSDGTVENVELHWGTESGNLDNTINMSTTRATYTTDSPIPSQADGTTVYYEVFAEDNESGTSTSAELSYTVTDPATTGLPYEQTFDADLGDTYTYSVSGDDEEWYWYDDDGNGVAAMNGYDTGDTEIDWLILPGINLDEYESEFMTFESWYQYGTDNESNYLKLYYSTDYEGVGDPSEATWTELEYNQPESEQTWASSGEVDLSGISGTQVYIGYKYKYEPGMYRLWQVDNISIQEEGSNETPEITNVTHTPEVVTSSDEVNVSADVTDPDGSVDVVELNWGTESGNLTNIINMSTSRATYTTDSPIPSQPDGTTVYYKVYAMDNGGGESTSSEMSYTVTDPATTGLPYEQTFDADLGDAYTYSVSGDTKEWYWSEYDGNGFAAMNGYDSGDTEIDWLILPGINFDEYENEFMTFDTWYNYGEDNENNYLKLYYSTDYEGVGDPSEATWTELEYNQPESAETWASSGDIDLSGISGTQVYIGYKYRYEQGMYRQWEVDNISIDYSTGIASKSDLNKPFSIYPNPSSGQFTVDSENLENAEVAVYSITGAKVYETRINSNKQNINLSNLDKGVYTLRFITQDNKVSVRQVVIK